MALEREDIPQQRESTLYFPLNRWIPWRTTPLWLLLSLVASAPPQVQCTPQELRYPSTAPVMRLWCPLVKTLRSPHPHRHQHLWPAATHQPMQRREFSHPSSAM